MRHSIEPRVQKANWFSLSVAVTLYYSGYHSFALLAICWWQLNQDPPSGIKILDFLFELEHQVPFSPNIQLPQQNSTYLTKQPSLCCSIYWVVHNNALTRRGIWELCLHKTKTLKWYVSMSKFCTKNKRVSKNPTCRWYDTLLCVLYTI